MTLHSLGITAIGPQGEAYPFPEDFIKDLCNRFEKVIILYDNDKEGIKCAQRLSAKTGLTYQLLPEEKDVSDLVRLYISRGQNPLEVKNVLDKLPENLEINDKARTK